MLGFVLLLATMFLITVAVLRAMLPVECRPHHIKHHQRRDRVGGLTP